MLGQTSLPNNFNALALLADTGSILVENEAIKKSRVIGSKAVLFGIPEPRKKYLLADTSTGMKPRRLFATRCTACASCWRQNGGNIPTFHAWCFTTAKLPVVLYRTTRP
jgi:hypothetical protein